MPPSRASGGVEKRERTAAGRKLERNSNFPPHFSSSINSYLYATPCFLSIRAPGSAPPTDFSKISEEFVKVFGGDLPGIGGRRWRKRRRGRERAERAEIGEAREGRESKGVKLTSVPYLGRARMRAGVGWVWSEYTGQVCGATPTSELTSSYGRVFSSGSAAREGGREEGGEGAAHRKATLTGLRSSAPVGRRARRGSRKKIPGEKRGEDRASRSGRAERGGGASDGDAFDPPTSSASARQRAEKGRATSRRISSHGCNARALIINELMAD
ncbi:hypothetical protein KM043_010509 [Ampulex compressa]|nr:hypothetical protein KM043_010509 [Ampulex compressa]